jgi:hypothetical protein
MSQHSYLTKGDPSSIPVHRHLKLPYHDITSHGRVLCPEAKAACAEPRTGLAKGPLTVIMLSRFSQQHPSTSEGRTEKRVSGALRYRRQYQSLEYRTSHPVDLIVSDARLPFARHFAYATMYYSQEFYKTPSCGIATIYWSPCSKK